MGLLKDRTAQWNKIMQTQIKSLKEALPVYDLCKRAGKNWASGKGRAFDISHGSGKDLQLNFHLGPEDNLKKDAILAVEMFETLLYPLGFSLQEYRKITPSFTIWKGSWWINLYFNIDGTKCRSIERSTGRTQEITETIYECTD